MESDWYRSAFPGTRISRDKNMELNYVTTRQGFGIRPRWAAL